MKDAVITASHERDANIPSLDGFRAVSILIVFLSHAGLGHIIPGGLGVTIFFFISGFLITTLLFREYDKYGTISLFSFYMRRAFRILPPLLITLAVAILLVSAGLIEAKIDISALLSQIFFFTNYVMMYTGVSFIPGTDVLWSLAVEEHFYLIWPLTFIPLIKNKNAITFVSLALFGFLLWRLVRFVLLGTTDDAIYRLSDTRLDSLLYGCLLALLMWRGKLPWAKDPVPWTIARNMIIVAAFALLAASLLFRDETFRATLRYSLQGLALMPIFYYAVTRPEIFIFRPLNWALVRRLGDFSYSFYLVHFIFMRMFEDLIPLQNPTLPAAVVSFVLATLYSSAMFHFIETPSSRLRKRLTGHLKPFPRRAEGHDGKNSKSGKHGSA